MLAVVCCCQSVNFDHHRFFDHKRKSNFILGLIWSKDLNQNIELSEIIRNRQIKQSQKNIQIKIVKIAPALILFQLIKLAIFYQIQSEKNFH